MNDKQDMLHTFIRILFNLKKEGHVGVRYNPGEILGYYAKQKKPSTKRQIVCDSTYIRQLVKV
jgi:hypothetical protein